MLETLPSISIERAQGVACLLALIAPCGVSVSIPKEQGTQHGEEES
jgi:hypothetical protein